MCSFIFSLTSALDGGGWSTSRPSPFTPGKETQYPLYRRLGGRRGWSGWVQKISPPLGFYPRTVQPIVSGYTDYAIPAPPQTVKVKQSYYRPWQALRVPGGWGCQILRQSAHEGGRVVSPTNRLPLPPGSIPGTYSVRGWVDPWAIVWPEGLCQWKIPMTPSGIDPATFWFLAQYHCRHYRLIFKKTYECDFPAVRFKFSWWLKINVFWAVIQLFWMIGSFWTLVLRLSYKTAQCHNPAESNLHEITIVYLFLWKEICFQFHFYKWNTTSCICTYAY
jgi:hypothetical protein